MNEIISIKQLPIIEERLVSLEESIKERTANALKLVVTNDTVKDIKKVRADLSKEFKELETIRKNVKKKVLEPYDKFEETYKEVTSYYAYADKELAIRIAEIENIKKEEKRIFLKEYFDEYSLSLGLNLFDFIKFERANINVTLTSSIKSLKESIKGFLDKINCEIESIQISEHKEELLIEYSKNLDLSKSMYIVTERYNQIEENKKRNEELEKKKQEDKKAIQNVEVILEPPKKIEKETRVEVEEQFYTVSFNVTGTAQQLKKLKEFLTQGGYKYE